MDELEGVEIRQVCIAGIPASIEGRLSDPYFQNVEAVAQGFGTLAALAARHAAAGSLILDVGANIGLSTIALARTRPDQTVIAFEPSPVNATLLRRNLAANNVTNVTVMQIALSDRDGELAFHEAAFGAGSHMITADHLGENWKNVAVPMITLDQVLRQHGGTVAFAKIDAEGHEPNILAGARQVLERDAPLLYMEFNSWCLNAFGGHSPAAFARALWRAFTVSRADPTGVLSEAADGPIDFLHGNLTQHGCVDDLVLRFRRGVEFPSLTEMSWPSEARGARAEAAAALQRELAAKERVAALEMEFVRRDTEYRALRAWIESYQASTSWRVTKPLRAAGRLMRGLRSHR